MKAWGESLARYTATLKTGTLEEWDGVIFYFLLHKFQVLYKGHELILQ